MTSHSHGYHHNHHHHHHDQGPTRIILIPPTTDMTIVFPYNSLSKTFERGFYSPPLTEGRASNEDIGNMLRQFEQVIAEGRRGNGVMMCFFLLFFFGGFALTVYLCNTVFASDSSSSFMFIIPLTYMFLFAVMGILMAKRGRASMRKTRATCQQIIDRNGQFSSAGLRWCLPMSFPTWVELWKDYRGMPQTGYYNYQMAPPAYQYGGNSADTGLYVPPQVVNDGNQYPAYPQQPYGQGQGQANYYGQ